MRDLRRAVLEATVVIAVSAALANRVADLTGRHPVVLPIGINFAEFYSRSDAPGRARARLSWPLSAPIVTFIGSLTENKGVLDVVDACTMLREDARLLLVGDGPLRSTVAGTAAARSGRAKLIGPVPHDVIPDVLAASDVIVLPSYAEGLPTVLVEAGAMGTPVVATAVGGIPELVGADRGLLCQPGDPEGLAALITLALEDRPASQTRAAALQEHVRAEHDANRQASRLLTLYEEIVA